MKTKIQKIKEHFGRNSDTYIMGSIYTCILAATGGLTYIQIKSQNEHDRIMRKWTAEEWEKGRVVVQLADGNYLSVKPGE